MLPRDSTLMLASRNHSERLTNSATKSCFLMPNSFSLFATLFAIYAPCPCSYCTFQVCIFILF